MTKRDLLKLEAVCREMGVDLPERWLQRKYRFDEACRELDEMMRQGQLKHHKKTMGKK